MFDAVLERNVPHRQLGKGALLAIGIHAMLVPIALLASAKVGAGGDGSRADVVVTFAAAPGRGGNEPSSPSPVEEPAANAPIDSPPAIEPAAATAFHAPRTPKTPLLERPSATTLEPAASPVAELPPKAVSGPLPGATSGAVSIAPAGAQGSPSGGSGLAVSGSHGTSGGGAATSGRDTASGAPGGPPGTAGTRPSETVLPFGEGMTRPTLLRSVTPTYTHEALVEKTQGLVLVKCVITIQGTLENCRVVKGLPSMNQAVLAALAQWQYSPVMFQGRPVKVDYVIPVRLVPP